MNNVNMVGRLTKEAVLRKTQDGKAVCSFTLAVDSFNDKADFVPCVAWEKRAEVLSNYCGKGTLIGVSGRIQTRDYKDKDDRTVYVVEVVAERIDLLEPRKRDDHGNKIENNTPKYDAKRENELKEEQLPDEEDMPW
jgi:single-strand DNA-binding protein